MNFYVHLPVDCSKLIGSLGCNIFVGPMESLLLNVLVVLFGEAPEKDGLFMSHTGLRSNKSHLIRCVLLARMYYFILI